MDTAATNTTAAADSGDDDGRPRLFIARPAGRHRCICAGCTGPIEPGSIRARRVARRNARVLHPGCALESCSGAPVELHMEGLSAADRDEMLQLFHGAHAARCKTLPELNKQKGGKDVNPGV